ncbi:hypothetical protein K488DRAFT_79085 [Vararia minispora EC-137]|uniref:Uncharacterized protein n=1 Tax=Vararia minispora EC-137 TaxID=1314806 RepID=A0ACB8QI06_9AGAM|nr:hypothetical protein K488DRAFT_79085 [Vararia minispora EC-137]
MSSASRVILLYDLPGKCAKDEAWSPNVWKVRFILNYKRIPYKTMWIEFPDIANVAKDIGAPPAAIRKNGDPWYAVPFIYDPATRSYVSTSTGIARHLDTAYPDTPKLFPPGTDALISAYEDLWMNNVFPHISPLMMERVWMQLSLPSQAYFRKTREAMFRKPLEELCPAAEAPALWKNLEKALDRINNYMASGQGPFIGGKSMTYADVMMAGWFVWIKRIYGPESPEWRRVEGWHGGRWGRLMAEFAKIEYTEGVLETAKIVLRKVFGTGLRHREAHASWT